MFKSEFLYGENNKTLLHTTVLPHVAKSDQDYKDYKGHMENYKGKTIKTKLS